MRAFIALASAAVALMPAAAFAQTTYNDTGNFFGNLAYTPANAAVVSAGGDELFARAKIRYDATNNPLPAPTSSGNTYQFALGSGVLGFDFGATSASGFNGVNGTVTITNVAANKSVTFDAINLDNAASGNTIQNSENLGFAFLSGVGFDQNVNDTYQFTYNLNGLTSGSQSLTIYAQYGSGAPVPEAATWGMMILGFGAVGFAARRVRRSAVKFA